MDLNPLSRFELMFVLSLFPVARVLRPESILMAKPGYTIAQGPWDVGGIVNRVANTLDRCANPLWYLCVSEP